MMIHKIDPHKYYPEFRNQEPKPSDYLLLFDGEKVYLPRPGRRAPPAVATVTGHWRPGSWKSVRPSMALPAERSWKR